MKNDTSVLAIMKTVLDERLLALEKILDADVLTIVAPLLAGLEQRVRVALDLPTRKPRLAIVLDTLGGTIEIVERIVQVIRSTYGEVWFVVPDKAMSAGTAFVMSGDEILMDSFSVLGPIDTQVAKVIKGEPRQIPVHAYLAQADALLEKAANGTMTNAELAILTGSFDLGELHQFREVSKLTKELVRDWLARYKFKDWTTTETTKQPVNEEMRRERAENIAEILDDYSRWHSHGRGIPMETLTKDQPEGLGLKIKDFGKNPELAEAVRRYYNSFMDLAFREDNFNLIHTRELL